MVEAIIVIPIVIFACMLTLQISLLYRAKIALNFATQEAARVGSMSNARVVPRFLTDWASYIARGKSGNTSAGSSAQGANISPSQISASDGREPDSRGLQSAAGSSQESAPNPPSAPTKPDSPTASFFKSFGKGLLRYGDSSVLQGFINGMTPFYTKGPDFLDIAKGQINAYGDAMINSCILYHNPTQSAFLDFGFVEIEGPDRWILQIPNDFMRYRIPGAIDRGGKGVGYFKKHGEYLSDDTEGLKGVASSMSIQDATLLSIEIKYSVKMVVPMAREIIIGVSRLYNALARYDTKLDRAFDEDALRKGRWPMRSYATYRMQSPVHWNVFMPFDLAFKDISVLTKLSFHENIRELWSKIPGDLVEEEASGKPQIGFCPGLLIGLMDGGPVPGKSQPIVDSWIGDDYDRLHKESKP
jgi:hypothetical protein